MPTSLDVRRRETAARFDSIAAPAPRHSTLRRSTSRDLATFPCRSTSTAFTLVELLVVIGIIAILVGILLPVLGRATAAARDVKCKSNLRQMALGAMLYAGDNKGTMPWGFIYEKSTTTGGEGAGNRAWISWYSLLNKYMGGKSDPALGYGSAAIYAANFDSNFKLVTLTKAFQCPEASAAGFEQQVSYYNNPNVMIHATLDWKYRTANPRQFVNAPLTQAKLYADTVLFWDTPSMYGVPSTTGLPFFQRERPFCIPAAGVDGGVYETVRGPTFARINRPELRFRTGPNDPFANLVSKGYSIYQSIWITVDAEMPPAGTVGGLSSTMNADLGANTTWTAGIGSVRFRHQKNASTNVVFSDGSVRSFTLTKNKTYTGAGGTSYNTDLKRYMFMPKYPGGVTPGTPAFTGQGAYGS